MLTLVAPFYRITGSDATYPDLRERLVGNFLDTGLLAVASGDFVLKIGSAGKANLTGFSKPPAERAVRSGRTAPMPQIWR